MSEPQPPKDVASYNESALEELAWAIEASVGQFKLFLARCNYTSLRSQMVERLRELMSVEIRILELNESEKTLYARIQAELNSEQPDALMVLGLESVGDLDQLLSATNQVREEFRKNFHFPVVLWVSDDVLKKLIGLAPDFESWAITTDFTLTTNELVDFLKETAERFFEGNLTLNLSACQEIKLACQDFPSREQGLEIELTASIESLLGFTAYSDSNNRNIDQALEHYQKGLKLWQQSNNLERQGQLLSDIAFCYYLKALRYQEIDHPAWQTTRYYLHQCFKVFEAAQRPDLVANSILFFGIILRRLQDWEQLQTLAQKALQLHQFENKPIEIAQDYGFLAEVALADKRWEEARDFAERAIKVSSKVFSLELPIISGIASRLPDNQSVISNAPVFYRFLLAQAQQHLNQIQEAIRSLEIAKEVGSPEFDTRFYLDILSHLQRLYFERKEYFKAFEIKLERQSIEQQYGFRAFVGAGRIQPQRQVKFALTQVRNQETIAPEITASGRQLDVERLIKRIGRNDCKLLVIHGESGVGKSSLVYGGLVPALKQKVIGTSDFLPVAMRVYTSWVGELGKLLTEALLEKGIDLPTPLDSQAAILEQLQQSESRNLRTVLIFDQFEEFFFVYPTPGERRQFFEFVGACLKILPVKVILSLREDYLHYLLECDRLPSMKMIGNDILTRNVRYRLGNFSPSDAKAIVQRLTQRSNFHLEPALIEELVRNLAGNLEEVRPIELQIVGAQLQTDNITTLAEYWERGQKEELVKRYLAEVVKDCGDENEQAAELVLYLLTDEKGTRPLKTRAELERDLKALAADLTAEVSKLDLVLKIFVDSGLVLLLPENPADRYQLVHDYIAAFIRQQQEPRLNELIAQVEKEREQRKRSEEELSRVLKRQLRAAVGAGVVLAALAVSAVGLAFKAWIGETNAQFTTDSLSAEALLTSNVELEALIKAVRIGRQLQQSAGVQADTKMRVIAAVRQVIYTVKELNRLQNHSAPVQSVSFSPDGKTIASASWDNTIKLWSLDGKELKTFKGHTSSVNSVSFSPDGKLIASASGELNEGDNTIKLWSLDGKELKTFKGHTSRVNSVSFSPDGKLIASASGDGSIGSDNTIKLWSLDGKELKTFKGHTSGVDSVSFSPDGKTIASAGAFDAIKIWSLDGKQLRSFGGRSEGVISVSFSPDGKTIASGRLYKTLKFWDLDGRELKTLKGHSDRVTSVRFNPDGKTIASASFDNTIKLWSLKDKELKAPKAHEHGVTSVSFSPDGNTIASVASHTIKLWSLDGRELKSFYRPGDWSGFTSEGKSTGPGSSISFSPDGKTIVLTDDNPTDDTIQLWSLDGRKLKTFKGHNDQVNSVSFSPDGKIIASGSRDKTIKLWNLDGKALKTFNGHTDTANSVSFSPDGKIIASGSSDRTIKLWDIDGRELKTFTGHTNGITSISFSPDGKTLISASADKTIKLWSLDGRELQTLKGHSAAVWSASFKSDGKTIASASADNTIKLWSLDGKELHTLKGYNDEVESVSFSPDGKTIASASNDGTVVLWNLNLDDLLVRSCNWLHDYLTTHPEVLEELEVCQNKSILAAAASSWVKQGEDLARKGDINAAIATFRKALKWNPILNLHPEAKAKQLVEASTLFEKGEKLAQEGNIEEAVAAFQRGLKLDPSITFVPEAKARQLAVSSLGEKGEKLAQEGNIEGAVAAFQRALKVDPSLNLNPKIKAQQLAVSALLNKGEKLAEEGNVEDAIASFQKALKLDPSLDLAPEKKIQQLTAKSRIRKGQTLLREGKVKEAIAAYAEAQKLDPKVEISADSWNALCWDGSLHGYPSDVMYACEEAIGLTPDDANIRDSRGLARALTGNTKGAIEDFQAYITQTDDKESKAQRERWINALRAGKNPFTPEEIKSLLY